MRVIHNECLGAMKSPIAHAMKFLHRALVNIAPEREQEFDDAYAYFHLEYVDSAKWICHVDPRKRFIRLSRRVVEVTWCASYAYMVFYLKKIQGQRVHEAREIDLHSDQELSAAMQLLSWAYENWLNNEDTPWPDHLPQPEESPIKGSFKQVADELCLCAMAYILHHELAHIRLNHSPEEKSTETERDADYAAADWIMHPSLAEYDPKFVKRALGIAVALEVLTSRGIYTGAFADDSHPPSYDRLVHTLRRFIDDPNHVVWGVVVATLKLHLDNACIPLPDAAYDCFLDCVEDYANALSRGLAQKEAPDVE